MWMKTCFHSHFYANFHASVTLLFLFRFSWSFRQTVELRNWEWHTPFWEVFAHFGIGKGPILGPRSGLGKSLVSMTRKMHNFRLNHGTQRKRYKNIEDLTWVLNKCFIEFIKYVGEKRSNARLAKHFIFFAASLINSIIQEHGCLILFITGR